MALKDLMKNISSAFSRVTADITRRPDGGTSHYKPMRKKPTISVYIEELNVEQKVASFNSQQTFEWFLKEFLGVEVNDG